VATTSPRSFAAVRSWAIIRVSRPLRRWVGLTVTFEMASAATVRPPTTVSSCGNERKVATTWVASVGMRGVWARDSSNAARVRDGSIWDERSLSSWGESDSGGRRKPMFRAFSQAGISSSVTGRTAMSWEELMGPR
jgi:hypothetical protein